MELDIEHALQQGVAAHKEGRLQDAERLYRAILQYLPTQPDANHNLGVLAVSVNKAETALPLFKRAIEANPKIEQFWLSYIDALIREKQFENAKQVIEQGKKQDIARDKLSILEALLRSINEIEITNTVSPSQAQLNSLLEHYQNGRFSNTEKLAISITKEFPTHQFSWKVLGALFGKLGRYTEAVNANQTAVTLSPQDAEAHSNLGATLKKVGRLDEAKASYNQAIALKPDYAEAHYNLGNTLKELGMLGKAKSSYTQAITLKPDYGSAMLNLATTLSYMNSLEEEIRAFQNVLPVDANNLGLKAGVNLAICKFLEGDFSKSKQYLLETTKIQEKTSLNYNNEKVYHRYLLNILKTRQKHNFDRHNEKTENIIYILGESHSLVSHHLCVNHLGRDFVGEAKLIRGCKQWHLGNSLRNMYKYQFESVFCSIPKSSDVLLAIGEIDCRLDSGIIEHKNKYPDKEVKDIIATTVDNYLKYVLNINSVCQHNIIVQGVPCPNIDMDKHAEKSIMQLIHVIDLFNCELKAKSKVNGFGFLDLYKLTDRGDGFSNVIWHLDNHHLTPDAMQEAWRTNYISSRSPNVK